MLHAQPLQEQKQEADKRRAGAEAMHLSEPEAEQEQARETAAEGPEAERCPLRQRSVLLLVCAPSLRPSIRRNSSMTMSRGL